MGLKYIKGFVAFLAMIGAAGSAGNCKSNRKIKSKEEKKDEIHKNPEEKRIEKYGLNEFEYGEKSDKKNKNKKYF